MFHNDDPEMHDPPLVHPSVGPGGNLAAWIIVAAFIAFVIVAASLGVIGICLVLAVWAVVR